MTKDEVYSTSLLDRQVQVQSSSADAICVGAGAHWRRSPPGIVADEKLVPLAEVRAGRVRSYNRHLGGLCGYSFGGPM